MSALRKFAFNRDFDGVSVSAERTAAAAGSCTEENAAHKSAFEAGLEAGRAESAAKTAAAVAALGSQMTAALDAAEAALAAIHADAAHLALAAAERICTPREDLVDTLERVLADQYDAPCIRLRVAEGMREAADAAAAIAADRADYAGRIRIETSTAFETGDVQIDWRTGRFETTRSDRIAAVRTAIAEFFPLETD